MGLWEWWYDLSGLRVRRGERMGRTPREKYSVSPKLKRYAAENGSRSFEKRCLRWFMGPISTANLSPRVLVRTESLGPKFIGTDAPEHN